MRINSYTEQPSMVFDGDTPEGRDGLKEAHGSFKLEAHTWLPFAAKTYEFSPNLEDFIYTITPILPSDLPNRNGIAFPLNELTRFQPPPIARMVYKAWAGCPIHEEHQNENYKTAVGVVLDTSLHKIEGFGDGKLWKIMALNAVSKTKDPGLCQEVLNKKIETYSMGAEAEYFTCSYCKRRIQKFNHCQHVDPEAPINWRIETDYNGNKHLVFLNAHNLSPIELSIVRDPAWTVASGEVLAPTIKSDQPKFKPTKSVWDDLTFH